MSVTSVEKKRNNPDHPGAESDSDNDDEGVNDDNDDNDNDDVNTINIKENEQNIIEPSEMHEVHENQNPEIDIDKHICTSPELNTVNNFLKDNEVMKED